VSGDGTVNLPMIGRQQVAELSNLEAAALIQAALVKDFFKKATVSVRVAQFTAGPVIMQGALVHPSPIDVSGDNLVTLFEAIARCGGLGEDAQGDQVQIYRWKPGAGFARETLVVNVREMMASSDLRGDLFLMPRDVVFVPKVGTGEKANEFLVLGEVGKPGFHPVHDRMDVIRAVTACGGLSRDARLEAARLLRPEKNGQYRVIPIDLQRLFGSAEMSLNVPVLSGDILFIPSDSQAASGQAIFLGELNKTGTIALPLDRPTGVARAILTMGGFTKFANESKVKVLRTAPDGSKQTLIIDVGTILKTGAFERDLPLRDEDVVIVPERTLGL